MAGRQGRFRVEGLADVERALAEVSKGVGRNAIVRGLKRAAEPMVGDIAANIQSVDAVDSGDLLASPVVSTKLSKRQRARHRKQSDVEVFIGVGPLSQATQTEFGNIYQAPRPYMRPAWDANRDRILTGSVTFMTEEVGKAAARASRKAARLAAKAGG